MKLAEKIMELRKKHKISQEQLAEELNVSRQSISLWENDQSKPSTEKLIELAKYFDVSIDELIKEVDVNKDDIIIKSSSTLESYKQMRLDVVPFIKRNLFKIILILTVALMYSVIMGISKDNFIIIILTYCFVIVPILLLSMIIIDNNKIKKVYNNNSSISKIFIFKSDELILKYDKNNLMTDLIIKYEDFNKAILTEDFLYLKQSTKDKEYYQINISDISTYEEARIIDLIKRNNIVISNKKINNKDVID